MTGSEPPPAAMPDDTSIDEVMAILEAKGFAGQMGAREGGTVLCFTCRQESPAEAVAVSALHRIEGVSDPDDMLAVAAVTCPRCGARATIVLGYGPEAAADDSDVLVRLGDAGAGDASADR